MTARIIRLARAGGPPVVNRHGLVFDSVPFMAVCPKCKDVRSQAGYSPRSLFWLLNRDRPIEAYCVVCDEHWPISVQERERLAELYG